MKSITINMTQEKASSYVEDFTYPAGETQVRLSKAGIEALKGVTSVTIPTRAVTGNEMFKLLQLVSAIRGVTEIGKSAMNIIWPYLPYGRADRRFVEGDCFGLEDFVKFTEILNANIDTLDVHNPLALIKLSNNIRNHSPKPYIEQAMWDTWAMWLRWSNGQKLQVLDVLFPDKGARDRYSTMFSEYIGCNICVMQLNFLHCEKKRNPETGAFEGFLVPGEDQFKSPACLLVDDLCDAGGTPMGVVNAMKERGNIRRIMNAYFTHGVFSKNAVERMIEGNYFTHLYATNSYKQQDNNQLSYYNAFSLKG